MAKINKDDLKIGVTFTYCKECDRVEVVRCKDCVHCDSGECVYHSEPTEQREYERWTVDVNENDFCSYGTRKEVANNG